MVSIWLVLAQRSKIERYSWSLSFLSPFQQDRLWLENEKNTWKLFYALYKNRLHYFSEKGDLYPENDLDIMKNFFESDNSIREVSF